MRETLDLMARFGDDDYEVTPAERRIWAGWMRELLKTGSFARLPSDWFARERERRQRVAIVALAKLAQSKHKMKSADAVARMVDQQLGAYRASGWRRDQVYGLDRSASERHHLLHLAVTAGDGWSPSHETIRRWEEIKALVNATPEITSDMVSNSK